MLNLENIDLQKAAELISLSLTFPTVILAIAVVWIWLPAVKFSSKSSHDWFISGVVVGFTGAALDNVFWFIAWSLNYLNVHFADDVFLSGVYFNIFFRQGLGIIAAYCHLKAADSHNSLSINLLNKILILSHVMGVLYGLILIFYATS